MARHQNCNEEIYQVLSSLLSEHEEETSWARIKHVDLFNGDDKAGCRASELVRNFKFDFASSEVPREGKGCDSPADGEQALEARGMTFVGGVCVCACTCTCFETP